MTMTRDEVAALYAPFKPHEHEVREGMTSKSTGKVQWFVYLTREAIIRRLDQLFPGEWGNEILSQSDTPAYSTCAMRIVIRGIGRDYNGGNSGGIGGENIPKAAATDAFKRVASMWGIGLYLQDSPQLWTDGGYVANKKTDWEMRNAQEKQALNKVAQWLKGITPQPSPAPDSGTNSDNAPQHTGGAANGGNATTEQPVEYETKRCEAVSLKTISGNRKGDLWHELHVMDENGMEATITVFTRRLLIDAGQIKEYDHQAIGDDTQFATQFAVMLRRKQVGADEETKRWTVVEVAQVEPQSELDAHFGERETAPMPGMPLPEDDVDFYRESE